KVFSVNLRDALEGNPLDNLLLESRDRVLVHRQPELEQPKSVTVQGDVAHPGRYPLAGNMRASDLIRAAGGLLRSANPESGTLTHYVADKSGEGAVRRVSTVNAPVNLTAALEGEEKDDLPLHAGDVRTVPKQAVWR